MAGTQEIATIAPSRFASTSIRVENLWKRYGGIEAVKGIGFEVASGEIFGLIGPDGAGKTSTFHILGGVMEATSGRAEIFGHPARDMRSQTGYLTQSFSLYPDLSVAENIRYTGTLRRVPPAEIERRSRVYLEKFDMLHFSNRRAGRLRNAWLDLQAAAGQVAVAARNREVTNENLSLTRQRFDAGVANSVEIVQSQDAVASADLDYISSVFAHNAAKLSLARAMGGAAESIEQFLKIGGR
jgi:ABC-type glutathione transport system ATPase component